MERVTGKGKRGNRGNRGEGREKRERRKGRVAGGEANSTFGTGHLEGDTNEPTLSGNALR
jgi:hypothetical protein